jgi:hypothetical protein
MHKHILTPRSTNPQNRSNDTGVGSDGQARTLGDLELRDLILDGFLPRQCLTQTLSGEDEARIGRSAVLVGCSIGTTTCESVCE